jgi:hypothetical protein
MTKIFSCELEKGFTGAFISGDSPHYTLYLDSIAFCEHSTIYTLI